MMGSISLSGWRCMHLQYWIYRLFKTHSETTTTPQIQLFVQSYCIFTAVGQPSIHFKQKLAHLPNYLETVTTAHVATRRPTAIGIRPTHDRTRTTTLSTNVHSLPSVWSQLTVMPQHMQSRLNRWSVSHLRRTYSVLHEHTV